MLQSTLGISYLLNMLLNNCYGANVNVQDSFGCTSLISAVLKPDSIQLAYVLLKRSANANISNSKGRRKAHVWLHTIKHIGWKRYTKLARM